MLLRIFFKTGEYYGRDGEWDGDDGYYESVLVSYDKINDVLVDMVYDDYFYDQKIAGSEKDKVKKGLLKMIDDMDMSFYEEYRERLEEYFSENNDELN